MDDLKIYIEKYLNDFYNRRIERIDKIELKKVLCRKNPYLFKALNSERVYEIIEKIVNSYIISSDETIFGDAFFEPIAKHFSSGISAPMEGVDMVIETDEKYIAYAIKSGPNPFNASAKKKQNEEFLSLKSRTLKAHKIYDPVLAYSYGKRIVPPKGGKVYREVAGQTFWYELTGDENFYIKLITLMEDMPKIHMETYKPKYDQALNRLVKEFSDGFCNADGTIDWEHLVKFVSENKTEE